ncbi:protein kinase, putative [Plasmodium ovale wallikeri]|uniref:Protein kinase, putative n=2 Tax=Plasmodium ovale TaxID=36330 RepID=A0A1A8ZNL2_PLAOA|nr:protein kinase, putative [Plasmodium ovale wallikeri]SBT45407.1 protein kinase, putative [Plasmodium ovale wallikeri]SBT78746.1 protein kinase, putative [Plasmodium ovale]
MRSDVDKKKQNYFISDAKGITKCKKVAYVKNPKFLHVQIRKKIRRNNFQYLCKIVNFFLNNNAVKKESYYKHIHNYLFIVRIIFIVIRKNRYHFRKFTTSLLNGPIIKYKHKLRHFMCKGKKKKCKNTIQSFSHYCLPLRRKIKCILTKTYVIDIYYKIYKHLNFFIKNKLDPGNYYCTRTEWRTVSGKRNHYPYFSEKKKHFSNLLKRFNVYAEKVDKNDTSPNGANFEVHLDRDEKIVYIIRWKKCLKIGHKIGLAIFYLITHNTTRYLMLILRKKRESETSKNIYALEAPSRHSNITIESHYLYSAFMKNECFRVCNKNTRKGLFAHCKSFYKRVIPLIWDTQKGVVTLKERQVVIRRLRKVLKSDARKRMGCEKVLHTICSYILEKCYRVLCDHTECIAEVGEQNPFGIFCTVLLYTAIHVRKTHCIEKPRALLQRKRFSIRKIIKRKGRTGQENKHPFVKRTDCSSSMNPFRFKKDPIGRDKIYPLFLTKWRCLSRMVLHVLKAKKHTNGKYYPYHKRVKQSFNTFLCKHPSYVNFAFNTNSALLRLKNKFIFNGMLIHTMRRHVKVRNSKLSDKRGIQFFIITAKNRNNGKEKLTLSDTYKRVRREHLCMVDVAVKLLKKEEENLRICSKIKNVIHTMESKPFNHIVYHLLVLKNFIHYHFHLFLCISKFVEYSKDGLMQNEKSPSVKRDKRMYHNKDRNVEKASKRLHPTQWCKKERVKAYTSFIHLFIHIFTLYVHLLINGLHKYEGDVKKRYLLLKIMLKNEYGILQLKKKIILFSPKRYRNVILTGWRSCQKGNSLYYETAFLSCLYKIVRLWNKSVHIPFPHFYNKQSIRRMVPLLLELLSVLLSIMHSAHVNQSDTFQYEVHTKCRKYQLKMENICLIVKCQMIDILLKKEFFYSFERILLRSGKHQKKCEKKMTYIEIAEKIVHIITHRSKKKEVWLYKYCEMYVKFLSFCKKWNIFKRKKITLKNCISSSQILLPMSGNRKQYFKEMHVRSLEQFYIHMVNKYFMLFITLSCVKRKMKRVSSFKKKILKILFLLSEQKNFTLQFYFYKIKVLEFMLHCMGEARHMDYSKRCNPLHRAETTCDCSTSSKMKKMKRLQKEQRSLLGDGNNEGSIYIPPLSLKRIYDPFKNRSNDSSVSCSNSIHQFSNSFFTQTCKFQLKAGRSANLREKEKSLLKKVNYSKGETTTKRDKQLEGKITKMCMIPSNRKWKCAYFSKKYFSTAYMPMYRWRKINVYNTDDEISFEKWIIRLVLSLITSYNKKDLNSFYFNENYYDENAEIEKRISKLIDRGILRKGSKLNLVLKGYLKLLNVFQFFRELSNAQELPIMRILQIYRNGGNCHTCNVYRNSSNRKNNHIYRTRFTIKTMRRERNRGMHQKMLHNLSVVKNLNRITLLRKINEDGNGKIYTCVHSLFRHNPFIIKLINIKNDVNENYLFKNIYNEIKCLLSFQYGSRRICQIYSYGIIKNGNNKKFTYYIIMNYYDCNLKEFLRDLHANCVEVKKKILRKTFSFTHCDGINPKPFLHFRKRKIIKRITEKCQKKKRRFLFFDEINIYKKDSRNFYDHVIKKNYLIEIIDLHFILIILNIFNQIVEEVMHIHRKGIVHFDINTCNIFMNYKVLVPLLNEFAIFSRSYSHTTVGVSTSQLGGSSNRDLSNLYLSSVHSPGKERDRTGINEIKMWNSRMAQLGMDINAVIFTPSRDINDHRFESIYVPSIVIGDFGESKFFFSNKDFLFFRANRGNEMLAAPELMVGMLNRKQRKQCRQRMNWMHGGCNHRRKYRCILKSIRTHPLSSERSNNWRGSCRRDLDDRCARFRVLGKSVILKGRSRGEDPAHVMSKYVERVKGVIKEMLQNRHTFLRRRRNMQKSDVWLLGCLLYEMVSGECLLNGCNFLYIKIYKKKKFLDEIIRRKIKKQHKAVKQLFNYFFHFSLKKRKSLGEIHTHLKLLYRMYVEKIKKEIVLLKRVEWENNEKEFPLNDTVNDEDRKHGEGIPNICLSQWDDKGSTYNGDETVFSYKGINESLFSGERRGAMGCSNLQPAEDGLPHFVVRYLRKRKIILSTDKENIFYYTFVKKKLVEKGLQNELVNSHLRYSPSFPLQNVKKIVNCLEAHNILRIYNFYFILHMDEKGKKFLQEYDIGRHAIFFFTSTTTENVTSLYGKCNNIIYVQKLYKKNKIYYRSNKNTKNIFHKCLLYTLSKKYKWKFNNFSKFIKIKIYKNNLKNLAYFFLFFFLNVQLKIQKNLNQENKKYIFVLHNNLSDFLSSHNMIYHSLPHNLANLFLFFFFFVMFKVNAAELFFLFKERSPLLSLSMMDENLIKVLSPAIYPPLHRHGGNSLGIRGLRVRSHYRA